MGSGTDGLGYVYYGWYCGTDSASGVGMRTARVTQGYQVYDGTDGIDRMGGVDSTGGTNNTGGTGSTNLQHFEVPIPSSDYRPALLSEETVGRKTTAAVCLEDTQRGTVASNNA